MPTRPSSAFLTSSARICWAATLFAESGSSFELPGTRPYHFVDFFLIFRAPGVPFATLRAFTNRALGAAVAQGRPSRPTQSSWSQYWITVTLNRLLAIAVISNQSPYPSVDHDHSARRPGAPGRSAPPSAG